MAYIDGNVTDLYLVHLDAFQKSVDDLELTFTADGPCVSPTGYGLDLQAFGGLVGKNGDSGTCVEHEPERLRSIINADLQDRAVTDQLKIQYVGWGPCHLIKRTSPAEEFEKGNQAPNSFTAFFVSIA